MFSLRSKVRWILIIVGVFIALLGIADYNDLINAYPTLLKFTFPYMWIVGAVIIILGFGIVEKSRKSAISSSDETPGMGERKGLFSNDSSFGGDGGGGGSD